MESTQLTEERYCRLIEQLVSTSLEMGAPVEDVTTDIEDVEGFSTVKHRLDGGVVTLRGTLSCSERFQPFATIPGEMRLPTGQGDLPPMATPQLKDLLDYHDGREFLLLFGPMAVVQDIELQLFF